MVGTNRSAKTLAAENSEERTVCSPQSLDARSGDEGRTLRSKHDNLDCQLFGVTPVETREL
jgi:hypothetical protein